VNWHRNWLIAKKKINFTGASTTTTADFRLNSLFRFWNKKKIKVIPQHRLSVLVRGGKHRKNDFYFFLMLYFIKNRSFVILPSFAPDVRRTEPLCRLFIHNCIVSRQTKHIERVLANGTHLKVGKSSEIVLENTQQYHRKVLPKAFDLIVKCQNFIWWLKIWVHLNLVTGSI